jgi:uncharacterized protein (DUF1778 family)
MPRKRKLVEPVRKDEAIRVRVTDAQKTVFTQAATQAGVSLSSWIVSTCLQAVRT